MRLPVFVMTLALATPAFASDLIMCNGQLMWGDGTGTSCPKRRAQPRPEVQPWGPPVQPRYRPAPQPRRLVVVEPTLKTIDENLEAGTINVNTKELSLY